jgi:putative effector of murein hydrolase LrgA (UPF0299 family)
MRGSVIVMWRTPGRTQLPAILDHQELIGLLGLRVLAVSILGTVIVMSVTALVVDVGCRVIAAMEARHDASC